MSLALGVPVPRPLRAPRRERRRLARQDRTSARLAELRSARELLSAASAVVEHGWVQDAWYAPTQDAGRPGTGACLVGAVVTAAGGPASAGTPVAHRALDLVWHALHPGMSAPADRWPAPAVRLLRVRELAAWNDAPARTAADVRQLLALAGELATSEHRRLSAPA